MSARVTIAVTSLDCSTVFESIVEKHKMKGLFLLAGLIIFSFNSYSQEFPASEGVYIGQREVRPSLSYLAPEVPSQNLSLREVNWNREVKREVNLMAIMEKTRYEKESSYVELDFAAPNITKGEKSLIEVTNELYIHERGSNYDIYTGKLKNPAYKEMRAGLFNRAYSTPYIGRGYSSPYSSSPFFR